MNNGPGITEREFVDAVTQHLPNEVVCVAPEPIHPEIYRNPDVRYAASHGPSAAAYARYLVSAFQLIRRILADHDVAGIAFRFGSTPLLPYERSDRVTAVSQAWVLSYSIWGSR